MSGLDLTIRSVHSDLYAWALSALQAGDRRVYDPSYALAQDVNIYEVMRRTAWIETALQIRANDVAGREWTVEAASPDEDDERLAKLAKEWLLHARGVDRARKRTALAFFYGAAYEQMRGEHAVLTLPGDTEPRRWWMLREFKNVDKRRFTQFREDGRLVWKMWHVTDRQWVTLGPREHLFYVRHTYDDLEAAQGYSRGLVEALYWAAVASGMAGKKALSALDRWAEGWVTAQVDLEREASTGKTTATAIAEWIATLKAMRAEHVLVYGKNDDMKLVETSGTGSDLALRIAESFKSDGTRLILGSLRPSGGGGDAATGARAQAAVEERTSEAVAQFDQMALDEAWSDSVVGLFLYMNGPLLRAAGLGGARPPRFRTVQQKLEDPIKNGQAIESAQRVGLAIGEDEAYRKYGLTKPKAGERLLKAPAPPPSPFGPPPVSAPVSSSAIDA